MKKILLFLGMALAITSCCSSESGSAQNKEQIVVENIQTRVSVRQFTGEKITDEQAQTLLKCAFSAPTAVNKQPWAIVQITDEAIIKQIGDSIKSSRCNNGPAAVFCLCGDLSKALDGEAQSYWIQDVSAAMENLLLAAHGMGLGALWVGVYPIQEKVNIIRTLLALPENIVPLGLAVVGHAAEQPEVKDKFKTENIHYNKW